MRAKTTSTTDAPRLPTLFPAPGEKLQIQLHGEGEEWFDAVALDRPRKLWCRITLDGKPFIADETNIVAWRVVA